MAILWTDQANCRDCYKCLRSCPMKAIQVADGRAQVVDSLCVHDGRCISICPQNAKRTQSQIQEVIRLLNATSKVLVSLAPSYLGVFSADQATRFLGMLKKLGVDQVYSTAEAAGPIAEEHRKIVEKQRDDFVISSSCPAIVSLVRKHYCHLIPHLAPVVSPMQAHAKQLKQEFPGVKVVFVGPCIAKKDEQQETGSVVDAILTFSEVFSLAEQQGIDWQQCPPASLARPTSVPAALFPVGGGLLKTCGFSAEMTSGDYIATEGLIQAKEVLDNIEASSIRLAELLACEGGCLGGVGVPDGFRESVVLRKNKLSKQTLLVPSTSSLCQVSLDRQYTPLDQSDGSVSEDSIAAVLHSIGKFHKEDELNCGACGYNTCREKAKAVVLGMAETQMCIPYMRSRAESMANMILGAIPVGIIVTNKELELLDVNSFAAKLFRCSKETMVGKPIGQILDPAMFEQAVTEKESGPKTRTVSWEDKVIKEVVFFMETEDVVIGILSDISQEELQKEELQRVKHETLEKTQEVINNQMRTAQEIAGLLGETTAETKVLLTKLARLIAGEEETT